LNKSLAKNPKYVGTSLFGFGKFRYKSVSQEGDWFIVGFSTRKAALTIYLMMGMIDKPTTLLSQLGKYKISPGCIYINKLSDIDEKILRELIENSEAKIKKKYC
jgi:hypothetical protein